MATEPSTQRLSPHRRAPGTTAGWLLLGAVLAWLAPLSDPAPQVAQQRPAHAPTTTVPEPPSARGGERLRSTVERLVRNIWWNQAEVLERLDLDGPARARMDASLRRMLAIDHPNRPKAQRARAAFFAALRQREFATARARTTDLAAAAAALASAQRTMKVEVLALLTPAQFALFARHYPHLFDRPWYRNLGLGSARAAQRRRGEPGVGDRSRRHAQAP